MAENLSNDIQTLLNGAITNVATAITTTGATGFPVANFRVRVDDELMLVTSTGSGTNWTVTRGIESTTAAAHATSAPVVHVLTAGGLDQYIRDREDLKSIYGLTYANSGTDSIAVASGGAMDSTGVYFMVGAALTKNVTTAWAVGSVAGGLDTGAVGNSDYYIWMIARPDTGVVDYLFSLSSTAPTMPTNYTYKRLIGWFKRVGAVNVAFTTYELTGGGIQLAWNAPTTDVSLANTLTTSRRTDALKVPLGFSTTASVLVLLVDSVANFFAWWGCPDETDFAPGGALPSCFATTGSLGVTYILRSRIVTSSAGLMAARASLATVDTYNVSTESFEWTRRN